MDSTQLALATLAVGAFIGGGLTVLITFALQARERARRHSSTELPDGARAVLQGLDETAVAVDTSLLIVAASTPAEFFGLREGEMLASGELRTLVRSARQSEVPEVQNLQLRRGIEPRTVSARASAITPRLTLVVVRDITERERVEQMRRDFVSNTSHELKTPVGAVSLLAEAVESAADDPDQVRQFAARIGAEARRLSQLTTRIMNLSRLQSADELADIREIAVDEIVAAAIDAQAVAAESAQIEIIRGGSRGVRVRGDLQILTDAIANLLSNAIAYSTAGSQVGVGVKNRDDTVEIAVTDRGIGIPEREQRRVFERFYRADQARSRRTGGTGLGLSIVKHAVQRHGGQIDLWSRPGEGTTVTVRLPALSATTKNKAKSKTKKNKNPTDEGARTS